MVYIIAINCISIFLSFFLFLFLPFLPLLYFFLSLVLSQHHSSFVLFILFIDLSFCRSFFVMFFLPLLFFFFCSFFLYFSGAFSINCFFLLFFVSIILPSSFFLYFLCLSCFFPSTRLYTLPCRSVCLSVTFLDCGWFLHYCPCPPVRDCIAVYPSLFIHLFICSLLTMTNGLSQL